MNLLNFMKTTSNEKIEQAPDNDIDFAAEIAKLEKICFPVDFWSEESVKSSLQRADILYGLEFSEGKAIGYYLAAASFEEGELYRIAILPEYRGQGLGKILMEKFLHRLPKDTQKVFLEVRESNKAAIGLYEKFGFIKISTRKNYYENKNGKENGLIFLLDIKM